MQPKYKCITYNQLEMTASMDKTEIIRYLLNLIDDTRYFNGSHYNMLNELSTKFDLPPAEMLELYRHAQQIWKDKEQNNKK